LDTLSLLWERTIRRYVCPDAYIVSFGLDIPEGEFMRRYSEAGRYPGFKYVGFLLSLWTKGQLASLHGPLLDQLLRGKRLLGEEL
jgi:hypothetical protein